MAVAITVLVVEKRQTRVNDEVSRVSTGRSLQVVPTPMLPLSTSLVPTLTPSFSPSQELQVRQHLDEAKRRFESGQFEAATDQLARVIVLDASNREAADLRMRIMVAAALRAAIETQRVEPPGSSAAATVPSRALDPHGAALQIAYEEGKKALLNGDYAAAAKFLESVVRDNPNYRDAAFLLDQTKMRLRDQTQAARKAEAAGDLATALRLYLEALNLGAGNQEDVNRVRATMTKAGTDAFNEAKSYYAFGQFEKALPLYQRAYQYLPETDPNRKIAKDRLDAIARR